MGGAKYKEKTRLVQIEPYSFLCCLIYLVGTAEPIEGSTYNIEA